MVPSGNALVGFADRAGYPVLTVPAGFGTGGAGRNPIGVTFVGAACSEAKLLAAGYAFEQATNVRQAPSFTNPSMFRCVPGSTFFSPHHCHPGDLAVRDGVRPDRDATRATWAAPCRRRSRSRSARRPTFGAFTPGVAKDYTASTTATVISTAGDATLRSPIRPGRQADERRVRLPQPLRAGVLEGDVDRAGLQRRGDVTFKQAIGAN